MDRKLRKEECMRARLQSAWDFIDSQDQDLVIVGNKVFNSDKTKLLYAL